MARQHIYTVLSTRDPDVWSVVKMDRDHDVVETYEVKRITFVMHGEEKSMLSCSCFASSKETCRHRQMLDIFQQASAIDSRRAYDFDRQKWIAALGPSMEMM